MVTTMLATSGFFWWNWIVQDWDLLLAGHWVRILHLTLITVGPCAFAVWGYHLLPTWKKQKEHPSAEEIFPFPREVRLRDLRLDERRLLVAEAVSVLSAMTAEPQPIEAAVPQSPRDLEEPMEPEDDEQFDDEEEEEQEDEEDVIGPRRSFRRPPPSDEE